MTATFHSENSNSQVTSAASYSITNTISAGDSVVVFGSWDAASTTTPTVVTTGGTGSDSFTLVYGPFTSGGFKYGAWLLQSAGSGRTGVTWSWASSSPSFADGSCISFSGLPSPVLDGTGFDTASSSNCNSFFTATLQSADEFAIGYAASTNAITSANAPWVDDGVISPTSSWVEHRILSSTAQVRSDFTQIGTWISFVLTFMAGATSAVVLGDYTLDNGLTVLDTVCDKIFVCAAAPSSYSNATSGANSLGSKNWGTGAAFGAPAARSGGGRQITSTAITDGTISTAGTVAYWAAVDSANSRLLAYGSLTGGKAVTVGQVFTLSALTIGIPNT